MRTMSYDFGSNVSSGSTDSSDSGIMTDGTYSSAQKNHINISTTITDNRRKTSKDNSTITIENTIRSHDLADQAGAESRQRSPTVSIRSTNISIESIDEDYQSSVIDSDDSDFDNEDGSVVVRKLGEQTASGPNVGDIFKDVTTDPGRSVIIQQIIDGGPGYSHQECASPAVNTQIGTVAVKDSSDVTFGNKTFYQGPVTIKQFVVETSLKYNASAEGGGNSNPAYDGDTTKDTSNTAGTPKDSTTTRLMLSKKTYIFSLTLLTILITVAVIVFIILNGESYTPAIEYKLRVIPWSEWSKQPIHPALEKLSHPIGSVIIAHTDTSPCTTQESCTNRMRSIQTQHIGIKFDDIGYNFLVGGDGAVYEARGWNYMGAHTKKFNNESVGIAFIGNFISEPPPEAQLKAGELIMAEGVKLQKLSSSYKLFAQSQLRPTKSPGQALYRIIQKWDHWTDY